MPPYFDRKSRTQFAPDRVPWLLLSCQPADEFSADVAKGCHHGSDDIDLRFVRAMAARRSAYLDVRASVVMSGSRMLSSTGIW